MSQELNQFSQTPVKGDLDLRVNPNVVSGRIDSAYDSDANGKIPAGMPLKLKDVVSGVPVVQPVVNNTDVVFGFAVRNHKDKSFDANDELEIARSECVMYMESGAALAPGAKVQVDPDGGAGTGKDATAVEALGNSTEEIGFVLDKATGAEELIRVVIFGALSKTSPAA